ncbi:hypothetical protein NCCP2222_39200 [Sporosarcina sp. NCCP-2222]|uniref:YolD-like family protein n=1 Tax=Sporosarcina sp. NCCP-2222 TaxID=2935073 RepID=UPI002081C78D|nr:YolD-like family protein [Sporosarcina sp. NCCP-2222]GKV57973.1 hypothetical protein NCCP2222_39200 [Sporosarcina sp. NCCP-2222]
MNNDVKYTKIKLITFQLRDWQAEDVHIERPESPEWNSVALQEELALAFKRKCQARNKTWSDGRIIPHRGIVVKIDTHKQAIILADPFGDFKISIEDIISVRLVD